VSQVCTRSINEIEVVLFSPDIIQNSDRSLQVIDGIFPHRQLKREMVVGTVQPQVVLPIFVSGAD
jgi:hypothetical protein